MIIRSAIIEATKILKDNHIKSAQLDTEILMAKVIGKDRKYVILNYNKDLQVSKIKHFKDLIKQRISGKPIAYLTSKKFFGILNF